MNYDSIVRDGRVLTPSGLVDCDIGVRGESIAALEPGLAERHPEVRSVDAAGHLVLPGVIDVHTHLELPFGGTTSADDWITGTRAGARGGVTSLIDFAMPAAGQSLIETLDANLAKAEGKALIDYSFHLCITDWDAQRDQVPAVVERGVTSFKEFMIYASQGWQSGDRELFLTLEDLRDRGALLMVHAESSTVLDELIARRHNEADMRKYGARLHAMTRPPFTESEAVQRAIAWAEATGGSLYIVHMSAGDSADRLREARTRGARVLAETCPQYLTLDDSVFEGEDGHLFACQPQVKKPSDRERLWKGLADGEISVVSTDTCSFTREQKDLWRGDFTKIPMGLPGLETLLPLLYTEGVLAGRLSLEQMSAKLSANPARIFGLHPRKGRIALGADADLAIIHPERRLPVRPSDMETNTDWNPWEGRELAGFARSTISRGEVIVDDYRVVGEAGRGRWLPRGASGIAEELP